MQQDISFCVSTIQLKKLDKALILPRHFSPWWNRVFVCWGPFNQKSCCRNHKREHCLVSIRCCNVWEGGFPFFIILVLKRSLCAVTNLFNEPKFSFKSWRADLLALWNLLHAANFLFKYLPFTIPPESIKRRLIRSSRLLSIPSGTVSTIMTVGGVLDA